MTEMPSGWNFLAISRLVFSNRPRIATAFESSNLPIYQSTNSLSISGPRNKSLRISERNPPAHAMWNGVERMLRPGQLEQHGCCARLFQRRVEHAAEARFDDVIARAVDAQRGRGGLRDPRD